MHLGTLFFCSTKDQILGGLSLSLQCKKKKTLFCSKILPTTISCEKEEKIMAALKCHLCDPDQITAK